MTESAVLKAAAKHRGTLFVEDATILSIETFPGEQYVLRLEAPRCASHAKAGSFIHLRCDDTIPMRRPLSIMRANPAEGWIEVLFKIVGEGLKSLGHKKLGDKLNCLGPIGNGFELHDSRPRTILIGGGVGIPPMVFLAEQMQRDQWPVTPLVLMGSELAFPFKCTASNLPSPWLDLDRPATIAALEAQDICARLASLEKFAGVYQGYVTDLARRYLESLTPGQLEETEVFSCGPTPMLKAVAQLAANFGIACQVSLEEYMACAVGGCAGCTVHVETPDGPAMKRVCVDGPVFDASQVFAFS